MGSVQADGVDTCLEKMGKTLKTMTSTAIKYHYLNFVFKACLLLCLMKFIDAKPTKEGTTVVESPPSGYVLNIIADLGTILKQRYNKDSRFGNSESSTEDSEKRGIDFGLGRGYSGSQAARHMLGLQQVNFAGGPGKKKRSGPGATNPVMLALPIYQTSAINML